MPPPAADTFVELAWLQTLTIAHAPLVTLPGGFGQLLRLRNLAILSTALGALPETFVEVRFC